MFDNARRFIASLNRWADLVEIIGSCWNATQDALKTELHSQTYISEWSITRPANTTQYTAGDVIGVDAGTKQVTTATAAGTVTQGVQQVETATFVGTITAGVQQVETATFVGTITAGTAQVNTATVVGTVTGDGTATVVVTGANILGSPITLNVAVTNTDTAATVAGKIRTALGPVDAITDFWGIGGTGADIVATGTAPRANDATFNISIDNGTCTGLTAAPTSVNTTPGVAPGTGNAKVTITGAGIAGSPLVIPFAVTASDNAAAVGGKARTAVGGNAAVTALYTVGGTNADLSVTRTNAAANDGTLNIAIDNDTCTGLTPAATSTHTTAGVNPGTGNAKVTITGAGIAGSPLVIPFAVTAADDASAVGGKARTAVGANAAVTALYTVGGTNAALSVTRTNAAANDGTLNIAIDNDTCTGLTPAATSTHTTAGVKPGTGNAKATVTSALLTAPRVITFAVAAGDTAATWAGKARTAVGADATVSQHFTISGTNESVVATAKQSAANDATLNIALDNDTSTGITPAPTSAATTAGSLTSVNPGSAIIALTNFGPPGGRVMMQAADFEIDVAALPTGATTFEGEIYNAIPDARLDNEAFVFSSAGDRNKHQCTVNLGTPVAKGGTCKINVPYVGTFVQLAEGSTTAYMQLKTNGGYTPTSGAVKRGRFHNIAP